MCLHLARYSTNTAKSQLKVQSCAVFAVIYTPQRKSKLILIRF